MPFDIRFPESLKHSESHQLLQTRADMQPHTAQMRCHDKTWIGAEPHLTVSHLGDSRLVQRPQAHERTKARRLVLKCTAAWRHRLGLNFA